MIVLLEHLTRKCPFCGFSSSNNRGSRKCSKFRGSLRKELNKHWVVLIHWNSRKIGEFILFHLSTQSYSPPKNSIWIHFSVSGIHKSQFGKSSKSYSTYYLVTGSHHICHETRGFCYFAGRFGLRLKNWTSNLFPYHRILSKALQHRAFLTDKRGFF